MAVSKGLMQRRRRTKIPKGKTTKNICGNWEKTIGNLYYIVYNKIEYEHRRAFDGFQLFRFFGAHY